MRNIAIGDAAEPFGFSASLQYFVTIGSYYFVHAGVRPGVALDRQVPEDLLWIRDEFLLSNADHGAVVVHGHTPMEEPVKQSNRISVDTGVLCDRKADGGGSGRNPVPFLVNEVADTDAVTQACAQDNNAIRC